MKAVRNGVTIAESDDTVVVEGNHYFPESAVKREYLVPSNHRTMCSWKGQANYYSLLVEGDLNPDAVWYYPEPKEGASGSRGGWRFGRGCRLRLKDSGLGTRDSGLGTRDAGRGTRDSGRGTRDAGRGTRGRLVGGCNCYIEVQHVFANFPDWFRARCSFFADIGFDDELLLRLRG